MTDKWVSMNDKVNKKLKKKTLKGYQVNKRLMSKATCKCGVTVEDYKMVTIADKTFCIKCAMKYPT